MQTLVSVAWLPHLVMAEEVLGRSATRTWTGYARADGECPSVLSVHEQWLHEDCLYARWLVA